MRDRDEAIIQAFKNEVQGADPIQLLLTSEATGRATDQSVAASAVAAAVAASLGYPLPNYSSRLQGIFRSFILARLHDLNAAGYTSGPSLTNPPGANFYSYSYA